MADLSKVKVGSTTYNVKDITARNSIKSIKEPLYYRVESEGGGLAGSMEYYAVELLAATKLAYSSQRPLYIEVMNADGGSVVFPTAISHITTDPSYEDWENYSLTMWGGEDPTVGLIGYTVNWTTADSLEVKGIKATVV